MVRQLKKKNKCVCGGRLVDASHPDLLRCRWCGCEYAKEGHIGRLVRAELYLNNRINVEAVLKEEVPAPGGDYFYSKEFENIEEVIHRAGLATVEKLYEGHKIEVCLLWDRP